MFSRGTWSGSGLVAALVIVTSTACGAPDGRSDADSVDSGDLAMTVAAPAQQPTMGDIAAPAQSTPSQDGRRPAAAESASSTPHSTPVPVLGPEMNAEIPAETSQVLVASSPAVDSQTGTLTVYRFEDGAWRKLKAFDTHNGTNGWLRDRREGDRTSPIGVFTLSDAGGHRKDPGTELPYTQEPGLSNSAAAAYGDEYSRVFDYVIAIDYNRLPGTPPTDRTRPLGWDRGGGIWLHLDHDSGTNGCVTLAEEDIVWLLRTLDPAAHPRIAMGPVAELEK
ncbi:L,D-peptidoglycan transpeptidase YkuD (ErfK/YbiS/YcfS/YnhG family) [Brevibacterium sanguinis]|uniref:L,D-peptidoglycan transpeptidase YkuD (ErfK/YbiS/YcfS/YnhG family) n=2 Tax=Brevibacterium TaxID=1696 RepID=A0A366II77_9MICO|nr:MULTISPECIES: L,D-transpeptidase family protein [Brevibacterium]RBP63979.1 L,D-peptidoglycan transpeptidase YkuD (ErfK/YbiS/YcfS/YnhG family) [Brevibacterium sanguinis]RBP70746.1 L,D-peptidoglycan transpeptidase YkuD (ErfK/YbiS/YcfS/YnhG family) [Brevibacterium celere]